MKKAKLYIHIGTWKTGSSTIQYNLYKLRDQLKKEGFYYLCKENKMVINDGIVRGFTELEKDYISQSREKFKKILNDQNGSGSTTFISSAEEFSGDPFQGFRNARAVAKNLYEITKDLGLDISVIVYLRRQDDFFESLYQQSIRLGESHSFQEFLNQYDASDFNWYELLQAYADVFGKENLLVRRYHRKYLPEENSLIQDFGKVIGSTVVSEYEETQSKNKGFSRDTLEITRIMNKHFEGEERFKLRKIFDRVNAKLPFDKYSFFSANERALFLKQYEESNRAIASEYLDEQQLFPSPDYSSDDREYSGLSIETVIASFSKALLIVKEDSERENKRVAKNLRNSRFRFRLKRALARQVDRFPELKKVLRKMIGK